MYDLTNCSAEHAAWVRSKKICDKCQAVFDNWHARDDWEAIIGKQRHHSILGLKKSSESGCPICELILWSDAEGFGYVADPNEESTVEVKSWKLKVPYCQVDLKFTSTDGQRPLEYGFEVGPTVTMPAEPAGEVCGRTDSPRTWQLAKGWLENCLSDHPDCSAHVVDNVLPTRLMFIGSDDFQLRLCISEELPHNVKYLTLSHCWGTKRFETLTRNNISQFLSNIPMETLTKTLRDAVTTTRRLGFNYIWIDSLCIIQDDGLDWRHESTTMSRVYANSTLTIAAMDANNGEAGFLRVKDSKSVESWTVTLTEANSSVSSALVCVKQNFIYYLLDQSKLQSRAWVFQERFLSPRVLYLGTEQVVWECRTKCACESLPDGYVTDTETVPGQYNNWAKSVAADIPRLWSAVMIGYGSRRLTYNQDKLPAISGVSRLFAQRFQTEYLAGMWRAELVRQLVWHKTRLDSCLLPRPEIFQAPTWSWASINLSVNIPPSVASASNSCWRAFINVSDVNITLSTDDPFGPVEKGVLQIQGRLLRCGSVAGEEPFSKIDVQGEPISESWVYLDTSESCKEVYFLTVLDVFEPDEAHEIWGLVLEKSDTGPNTFSRVGAFKVYEDEAIKSYLDFEPSHDSCGHPKDIGEYVGVDDNGLVQYLITII